MLVFVQRGQNMFLMHHATSQTVSCFAFIFQAIWSTSRIESYEPRINRQLIFIVCFFSNQKIELKSNKFLCVFHFLNYKIKYCVFFDYYYVFFSFLFIYKKFCVFFNLLLIYSCTVCFYYFLCVFLLFYVFFPFALLIVIKSMKKI